MKNKLDGYYTRSQAAVLLNETWANINYAVSQSKVDLKDGKYIQKQDINVISASIKNKSTGKKYRIELLAHVLKELKDKCPDYTNFRLRQYLIESNIIGARRFTTIILKEKVLLGKKVRIGYGKGVFIEYKWNPLFEPSLKLAGILFSKYKVMHKASSHPSTNEVVFQPEADISKIDYSNSEIGKTIQLIRTNGDKQYINDEKLQSFLDRLDEIETTLKSIHSMITLNNSRTNRKKYLHFKYKLRWPLIFRSPIIKK